MYEFEHHHLIATKSVDGNSLQLSTVSGNSELISLSKSRDFSACFPFLFNNVFFFLICEDPSREIN